ncbi:thiocillin family RiPP [Rothia dentocariosa]|nr:thiocillin family RiPP [Rothia dentocariosa]
MNINGNDVVTIDDIDDVNAEEVNGAGFCVGTLGTAGCPSSAGTLGSAT